jgi:DNA-binding LacI/PurR family transcriptional regulator
VLIGRCADNTGLTFVDIHIEQGMWTCVDHLTQLGHRAIAYLHRQATDYGLEVRALRGFSAACQHYNVDPVTLPCAHTPMEAETSMNDLLDKNPEITAVIVWHDTSAWGVVKAAAARGCSIPEDLSIICGDYQTASNLFPFTPTTVAMGAESLAATGAEMIVDLLEGRPIKEPQVLLPIEFVVGESTAPPRPERVCNDGP